MLYIYLLVINIKLLQIYLSKIINWGQFGLQSIYSPIIEELIFLHDFINLILIFSISFVRYLIIFRAFNKFINTTLLERQIDICITGILPTDYWLYLLDCLDLGDLVNLLDILGLLDFLEELLNEDDNQDDDQDDDQDNNEDDNQDDDQDNNEDESSDSSDSNDSDNSDDSNQSA